MPSFAALTTPTPIEPFRYAWRVEDGWQQGRGAFGGLVLATLARALGHALGDPTRPLRSLSAEIPAPVLVGDHRIEVRTLRDGKGLSVLEASIAEGNAVLAHAVGVFGVARAPDLGDLGPATPNAPPWIEVPAAPPVPAGVGPSFAQHFEFRVVRGIPFSEPDASEVVGWARPRDPGPLRDAAYALALADAYYPALMPRLPGPRPMATVSFNAQIVASFDGLDPDAPVLHVGRTLAQQGGYAAEHREIYGHDGRLLVLNQQVFCVIR